MNEATKSVCPKCGAAVPANAPAGLCPRCLIRQGRVKVADFGLAKLVGTDAGGIPLTPSLSPNGGEGVSALTDAGKVMGTPQYMAPEQREHPTEVDHRADIYSLGVVFYQMLTGELPGKPIEAPSHKVRVDVRMDEVVLRALEKQPDRRYQRASEVKTAVETITNTPPSAQPQVAPAYVPQKAARPMKRRLGVLAVVLALAGLALALPLGWWRIHQELQNWSFFDAQRTLGVHHTMTGPSPSTIDGVKFRYRLLSGTPTSPATSARHAAATNLTFSPVIERVLPFSAPCRMQYFQFHTGNVFTIGDGPSDKTDHAEDYRRAEETGGLDVSVIGGKDGLQLAGEGCIFTHDKSPNWDTMTAEAAVRTLRHESWLNGVVEIQPKDFPVTYLFKTARGECGLLQILGVSDEPLGMKLRYKLVQGSLPPRSLAVTAIPTSPWGVVSNGLQMSLSPVVESNALAGTKRFEVRIRSVGDKDMQLNLGISLANGKVHLPKAISLVLTDAQGQDRVLEFADKKYPGVAGRVDDFVVGLQSGATYTLPLGLVQFWCPATREPQISLTNGPYRLTARFVGRGAEHVNNDTAGMQFMNFWRGTLQSNPLEFNVGQPNPPSGWPRMKLEGNSP